jgi:hypothetical protein
MRSRRATRRSSPRVITSVPMNRGAAATRWADDGRRSMHRDLAKRSPLPAQCRLALQTEPLIKLPCDALAFWITGKSPGRSLPTTVVWARRGPRACSAQSASARACGRSDAAAALPEMRGFGDSNTAEISASRNGRSFNDRCSGTPHQGLFPVTTAHSPSTSKSGPPACARRA